MTERISTSEVAYTVFKDLSGMSPLVAVLGFNINAVLLGRDGQRWIMTITEVPEESGSTDR